MKNKMIFSLVFFAAFLFIGNVSLEARNHRSRVSVSVGAHTAVPQAYVARPVPAPVYVAQPVPQAVVYPAPVYYQPVAVYPAAPAYNGFSLFFNWLFR